MTKVAGDVVFSGFGGDEANFTGPPPSGVSRAYRIIRASQGRIDLTSVSLYAGGPSQAAVHYYGSYLRVFRTSLSVDSPPTQLAGPFGSGIECLWAHHWDATFPVNSTWPSPKSEGHWTFWPGSIYALEGQQLIVSATQLIESDSGGTGFPACIIGLSALGLDYSDRPQRAESATRSIPRFTF